MSVSDFTVLHEFIKTQKELVDARLRQYLDLDQRCPALLREAMTYTLLGPGKRIRPILALCACQACGGDMSRALPGACAVEMIHAYSLIHDDLPAMDDDDLRRGRPTCHKRFDEATAILAADALQALAFDTLSNYVYPAEVAVQCVSALADAAGPCGMVAGQTLDVRAGKNPHEYIRTLDILENVHRLKTGALIRVSLIIGAMLADAQPEQIESLKGYGEWLGLLFQVTDDLLDVTADEADMGKRTHKDIEKGKVTYPGFIGMEKSQQYAAELAQRAKSNLDAFGENADMLRLLADYVLERKN